MRARRKPTSDDRHRVERDHDLHSRVTGVEVGRDMIIDVHLNTMPKNRDTSGIVRPYRPALGCDSPWSYYAPLSVEDPDPT